MGNTDDYKFRELYQALKSGYWALSDIRKGKRGKPCKKERQAIGNIYCLCEDYMELFKLLREEEKARRNNK